jgi:predicted AlkP superfamily phosphohydrolase/phosphomutase
MDEGSMPNLKRLVEKGAYGILRSTVPPITCPAWFTFSTGLSPSRLGIYDFRGIPSASNRLRYHNYADLRQPEFWDLLMSEGFSCGILNNPLLYPRKKHHGFIVPGFITPRESFRTYPEGLRSELDDAVGGYEVDVEAVNIVDDQTLLEDCLRVTAKRVEAISWLMANYPTDFFLAVFTSTDRVCHRFLNRALLAEGPEKDAAWKAIASVYRLVDDGIGEVMEKASEDDWLLVLSDHGFAAKKWNIHVNQYLVEEGILSVKVVGFLEKHGLTQRNLAKLLHRLGLMKTILHLAPTRLREIMPRGESRFGEFLIHDLMERGRIDWEKTKAVCIGYCHYLNTAERPMGHLQPREAEKLAEKIAEDLERLEDPDGGGGGIKVTEPSSLYATDSLLDPPDLISLETGNWQVRCSLPGEERIFTLNDRAGHSLEGIFVIRHPCINQGPMSVSLGLEDMAPLFLTLFDAPPLPLMDGKVPVELFQPDSPAAGRAERINQVAETTRLEREKVKSRVRSLRKASLL